MKKILSVVLVLASLATSVANAVILPPRKHFAAQSIPLDFYKKSAHSILKRFDFKNTNDIRAYLQKRIEVIHVACSQTEDISLLSQEYALLEGCSDLRLPDYEDCFWGTVVDYAQEYAEAYIRLMCNCKEKGFHVQSFELSNLIDDLLVVSHREFAKTSNHKISDIQKMRIHVRQFSKLACALIEILDQQEKDLSTGAQSPIDDSAQTRSQTAPPLQSGTQDSTEGCSAHTW